MTGQPHITDTHTWDGTHHLPDWLHWDGGLTLPGRDDTTPPQPGWMLVRWSDGLITVASPQVADRAFGPDGMRGRLQRAEAELADRDTAESADAAAGSYAGRAERVERQRDQLAALVRDFLDPDPCQLDHHGYCQAHGWAHDGWHCPHARAREALAALDDEPATEATGIETTARVLAALHRSAEDTVTRVIDLHERWVTAGAPPLGVPTARWWDARLVELRDAINPADDTPTGGQP